MLRNGELPSGYVHVFLNTGDDGPDQRGLRNSLHTMFASNPNLSFVLFFSILCLKHQYHLTVQSQLRLCDTMIRKLARSWKYFTSVATLSHTWRGHLAKIRAKWWQQHQGESGIGKMKATFGTPPLAIAGRWASIDGTLAV